jgi:nitrogen regulatory protein PII 1
MIEAVVRPERAANVLTELAKAGFIAATKVSVLGRGKQRGLKIGDVYYDEIPKEMIIIVVPDESRDKVIEIIMKSAKVDKKGSYGDGKIFVTAVESVYTISSETETL